ncbi:unnamed protein product, partial [Polarella glacialis]
AFRAGSPPIVVAARLPARSPPTALRISEPVHSTGGGSSPSQAPPTHASSVACSPPSMRRAIYSTGFGDLLGQSKSRVTVPNMVSSMRSPGASFCMGAPPSYMYGGGGACSSAVDPLSRSFSVQRSPTHGSPVPTPCASFVAAAPPQARAQRMTVQGYNGLAGAPTSVQSTLGGFQRSPIRMAAPPPIQTIPSRWSYGNYAVVTSPQSKLRM